jgi:hypothetical protein
MSYQRVATIFAEINQEPNPVAAYSKLIAHPVLCEMISICTKFRTPVLAFEMSFSVLINIFYVCLYFLKDFRTIFQQQEDSEGQDIVL